MEPRRVADLFNRVCQSLPLRTLGALAAVCFALTGCSDSVPDPAVDGDLAYKVRCAYCHDVPNGLGTELTPRLLAGYKTAGALDRYIRFAMPHEAPGSLEPAEYDAIFAYLLESRELLPAGESPGPVADSTRLDGVR